MGREKSAVSPQVQSFLSELDLYEERVPLKVLTRAMAELDIALDDVREFVEFDPLRYRRNLMYAGRGFQALVLCWRNGQRSPIHDHVGSSCGVRVLKGVMTETIFDRGPNGMIVASGSRELPEGLVCGSQDDDIHQVSNLQANDEDLLTLHIYSPPLLTMNMYSLLDASVSKFDDPVHELLHGAGI